MGWGPGGGVHRGPNFLLLVLVDRGCRPSSVSSHLSALFDCKNCTQCCTQCCVLISCHLEDPAFHLLFTPFLYFSRLFLSSFLPVRSPLPAQVPVPPLYLLSKEGRMKVSCIFQKTQITKILQREQIQRKDLMFLLTLSLPESLMETLGASNF